MDGEESDGWHRAFYKQNSPPPQQLTHHAACPSFPACFSFRIPYGIWIPDRIVWSHHRFGQHNQPSGSLSLDGAWSGHPGGLARLRSAFGSLFQHADPLLHGGNELKALARPFFGQTLAAAIVNVTGCSVALGGYWESSIACIQAMGWEKAVRSQRHPPGPILLGGVNRRRAFAPSGAPARSPIVPGLL